MTRYYLLFLSIILNSVLAFGCENHDAEHNHDSSEAHITPTTGVEMWNRNSEFADKIINASREYLANGALNAVYMFSDSNGVIEQGAEGFYSIAKQKKLEPSQQMPIASGTKTMTAAAILKLQDRNLLNVNDPISKHLHVKSGIWNENKMPKWADKITIHNLLTHRSGLSEYFMALKLDVTKPHSEINKDIANFTKELKFIPGEQHNYCNTNYVLLGLIIEQVSGSNLIDFYNKEFFEPLGLKNTKLITLEEAIIFQTHPENINYPERYFVTPNGAEKLFNQAQADHIMVPYADGGVASTTADLIKWHQSLHAGKVLSKESYDLMTTRHYEIKGWHGVRNYMGYGLYISELENGDILYQHAGSAVAIRSESGCIPSKGLCFAVLSNVMDYLPKELEGKVDIKKPENSLDIRHFLQHIFKAI